MQEKVKTPKQPVKGFVTVELFDKYGDKIQTVKSKNMITQLTKNHMIWKMKEDFFRGCPGTLPGEPGYYLNNIVLTSSTLPPQDIAMQDTGNVIGWANKSTYSGSDAHRGTINTAESYATNDKVHWVFDWPTHAANGTFQTILWGNIDTGTTGLNSMWSTLYNMVQGRYIQGLAHGGGYYWLSTTYSSYPYIFKIDPNSFTNIANYGTPDNAPRGITWGNNFLWLAGQEKDEIYKIDPANMTTVSSFSTPYADPRGLTWYNNHLWVICGDNKIYELNPDTGTVLSYLIPPKGNTQTLYFDNNGNIWASDPSIIYKFNPSTGAILTLIDSPTNTIVGIYLNEDGSLIVADNGYSGRIVKITDLQIGARTLLPQPVTKTSTNTMKVQYDFIFED